METTIHSMRGWFMLGAALLLAILALLLLLRERYNATRVMDGAATALAGSSSPPEESATEKARRAAIAALGPIKKRKGLNAADFYKEAMGLYAGLMDAEKSMLNWRNKLDPKTAAALYAKIQPIMDLLRKARKGDYADWGLGPDPFENARAETAELNATHNLAALALWDSNYRFQSDPDGAVGDVAATDAVGNSGIDSVIGLLVEQQVHSSVINLLAQNAARITSAAEPDLAGIVSPAGVEQNFQEGINANAAILQALLDEYTNPDTRSQAESLVSQFSNGTGAVTAEGLISGIQWDIQTEQALATSLTEPGAQFQQWWTQKLAEANSAPVESVVMPALKKAINNAQELMVMSSMLDAGLAIEQNDQTQFQSITDPATGQPFTYTQTANGFQLGSAPRNRGKPVSLSFSTPAAK